MERICTCKLIRFFQVAVVQVKSKNSVNRFSATIILLQSYTT